MLMARLVPAHLTSCALLSRFTIVGKKPELSGGGLVDIGRTGMVRRVTEHTEFVLSLGGVHFEVIGGARARHPNSCVL